MINIYSSSFQLKLVRFLLPICLVFVNLNTIRALGTENKLEFDSSNLPIMLIETGAGKLSKSAIIASLVVINNKEGLNSITDQVSEYNGRIEILVRGHSSSEFEKKSYKFETQASDGTNNNVSLLGMPKENDWILHGPYSDKSLIRNALVFQIASEINNYAPRTRFCELVINKNYQGVYLLVEKIKQGKNRVNIAKLKATEITEPEVSGGYVFKKEFVADEGDHEITLRKGLKLIIVEPNAANIVTKQTEWIKNYLNKFESVLYSNVGDYNDYIDVQSFADNFLMVELFKNIDGFRASTFFYKDRNSKIVAGPVWDYDLALGNADYTYGWSPERWYNEDEPWDFYWFDNLLTKKSFQDHIKTRWASLRNSSISVDHIYSIIDSFRIRLTDAQERNFAKWPILGEYIWPNPGYAESGQWGFPAPTYGAPTTWIGEIDYVKDFINDRIAWIDEQFEFQYTRIRGNTSMSSLDVSLYPNPCNQYTNIKFRVNLKSKVCIKMLTIDGQEKATLKNEMFSEGFYSYQFDIRNLQNGVYIIKLQVGEFIKSITLLVQK